MTGKEFEDLIIHRTSVDEKAGRYTMSRYGVMSTFHGGSWRPIRSLPDFEGVTPDGQQFIFDAKVCGQPAYDLSGSTSKSFKNQYRHMQRRAPFAVTCFLMIHFTERKLKTRTDTELTVAFPIKRNTFWDAYDAGSEKRITRAMAELYGHKVDWSTPSKRATKLSPDVLKAVITLRKDETKDGNIR